MKQATATCTIAEPRTIEEAIKEARYSNKVSDFDLMYFMVEAHKLDQAEKRIIWQRDRLLLKMHDMYR